jgi:hypothetical protein
VDVGEWIRTVGAAATPIAVLLTARQLRFNRNQAKVAFEDDLSSEYRSITRDLPPDAFHADAEPRIEPRPEQRNALFRYFDLSNEQLRIAASGKRVTADTASAWRDGIFDNMMLPRFREAFAELQGHLPRNHEHPRPDQPPYFTFLGPVAKQARERALATEAEEAGQVDM